MASGMGMGIDLLLRIRRPGGSEGASQPGSAARGGGAGGGGGPPPALWGASGAAGVQGWIATAWSWGLGPALLRTLRSAAIVARGASTAGALVGEGFDVDGRAGGDTLSEILDHLRGRGVTGLRVAVLPHGGGVGP